MVGYSVVVCRGAFFGWLSCVLSGAVLYCVLIQFPNEYLFMALRIFLQFGIVFAIGFYLGPASTSFAGAVADVAPELSLSLELEDPKDVVVVRGQAAVLKCNARAREKITITWLHNHQPIASNDTRRRIQSDGSLFLQKVGGGRKTQNLTGEYQCKATVAELYSMVSSPAKLRIASLGDFNLKQTSNLSVPESQPAILYCNINSFPPAEIQWEQNNKPLPHNTRYVPLPNGALLITKTHSSDAGSYRCNATNNLLKKTKHSKIVQLTVSSNPTKTVAPTFLPLDNISTVSLGDSLNFYCAVSGWPIPTVQWLNSDSIVISNSSVLKFRNVSFQDAGNYTCAAYNSGGRKTQKYTLDVQQKPYFNVTPISKTYPPARTVRLDCQARGVPKPKIYWFKNGEPLENAARIKKHPTGLVISHTFTSDSGIYQCFAVNAAGIVWSAAQLVPKFFDTPSPPENVQCQAVSDSSICFTWQSPQNVPVTAYSVYCYFVVMGRETPGPDYVTNKTQLLATSLNGSTNYTCYVRLYSRVASDPSEKVTCKTGIKGRRNLQVIPVNETAVELSWSKVSTDIACDGSKQSYKIQWRKSGRSLIFSALSEGFSHVITDLSPATEYEFRVIPSFLKSDSSSWVSFVPKGDTSRKNSPNVTDSTRPLAPEIETAGITATSINLTWLDNNENTRYFMICKLENYRKQKECKQTDLIRVSSRSRSLLFTDLHPNSSYSFKVRAHNFEGDIGPFSDLVTFRTHADVPSKVLNLNYELVNETTVCLHWQAPLHKNGKLLSYLILYTPNANWPLDDWLNKSVPTTEDKGCWSGDDKTFSTLLYGLESDKQYTVYVRAASEVGLGNPMLPIKINTRNIKIIEQQPKAQDEVENNQNLGIMMGVVISLLCLALCISCTILLRRRCLKTRAFARARMAASNNYYPAVAQYASEGSSVQVRLENPCGATIHEIEHLVGDDGTNHIPPDSAAHLDTKGYDGIRNGHINGSAKPYANGHLSNGIVHITENPRYYALECNGHVTKPHKSQQYEEDSNSNLKSTSKLNDLHRLFDHSKECNFQNKHLIKVNDECKNKTSFKEVRPNG